MLGFHTLEHVLTIYEQIQIAVDFAEADLSGDVTADGAAAAAGMSLRSFHCYFTALTGYRFGEYVRRRRLSTALDALVMSEDSVLAIALATGYGSHESFTRAFKKEYGEAPRRFRMGGLTAARTDRLDVTGEVTMGVVTTTLPEMRAVAFDGFRPEPEQAAFRSMTAWLDKHPEIAASSRSFGYNIDRLGERSHDPDNEGYRLIVIVPDGFTPPEPDVATLTERQGAFVVTAIEGSFTDDPSGSWITEGWRRLQVMVERQNLRIHPSYRWFEEPLEPSRPDRTRFDLYLEIEPSGIVS
jgi:AraC-like DNA-binding protein